MDKPFPLFPFYFLPTQVTPSPEYPWLQAQVKFPGLLVHVALESQLSVPASHLSKSGKGE